MPNMVSWLKSTAHRPLQVLIFALVLAGVCIALLVDWPNKTLKLQIDPAIERLLPAQDADRAVMERTKAIFGDTDPILISVRFNQPVFSVVSLQKIEKIHSALSDLAEVSDVFSLANAPNILASGDDLEVSSFTEQALAAPARMADIKKSLNSNAVYRNTIVSADGFEAAFAVSTLALSEAEFERTGYPEKFHAIIHGVDPKAKIRITGTAIIKRATSDALIKTFKVTVPSVFAVLLLMLLLAFKDVRLALAGVVTVGFGLLLTFTACALMGIKLHLLTALTPVLVVTQGLCYVIHFLSDFVKHTDNRPALLRAEYALDHGVLPLSLNAITSSAGFLALMVNDLPAIRQFALLTALGIVFSGAVSLFFLPAFVQIIGFSRVRSERSVNRYKIIAEWLAPMAVQHRKLIISVAGFLLVGGGFLAAQVEPSSEFVRGFPADSVVRQDYEAINAGYRGANVMTILVETHVQDALADPERSAELSKLAEWLRAQPEVGAVYSYIDLVKLLNRSLNNGDPSYEVIPDSASAIKQILIFAGGEQSKRVIDSQFQSAAIVVRVTVEDTPTLSKFVDRVEQKLSTLPAPIEARLTGSSLLAMRTVAQLTSGQWISVLLTAGLIWAILAVIFTSPRAAFLALMPNLVPVAIYFGLLKITGIGLTPTTSLIASIVLGISVDDTIHYMVRFNNEARARGSETDAVQHALTGVLRPITLTMLTLCLGFLVFLGSDMQSQAQFGALAAFTLFLSWLTDITLTPALASLVRVVTIWDLLRLDLGQSPQHTIPLLSGLSLRQARTFALLSNLEKYSAKHCFITEGDYARDIYVVVDGEVEAWISRGDERKRLATMGRGSVIGEAGYFGQRRTANVESTTAIRLLRFNSQDLERLRVRHPRIASVIFRNLNRVQAERIARMTAMVR